MVAKNGTSSCSRIRVRTGVVDRHLRSLLGSAITRSFISFSLSLMPSSIRREKLSALGIDVRPNI